jgi:thiamine monophosphate kinase
VAAGATPEEAISGGEDYELLIATDDAPRLRLIFHDRGLLDPITIGHVVASKSERTYHAEEFVRRGWQHQF